MPYDVIYLEDGTYAVADAITGEPIVEDLRSPEQVAQYMIDTFWSLAFYPEAEKRDAYYRWLRTAEIARTQVGEPTSIVPESGEPEPTPPPEPAEPAMHESPDRMLITLAFYPSSRNRQGRVEATADQIIKEIAYIRQLVPPDEAKRLLDTWVMQGLLTLNRNGTYSPTFNTGTVIVPLGFSYQKVALNEEVPFGYREKAGMNPYAFNPAFYRHRFTEIADRLYVFMQNAYPGLPKGSGIPVQVMMQTAERSGITPQQIESALAELIDYGRVYQIRTGEYLPAGV